MEADIARHLVALPTPATMRADPTPPAADDWLAGGGATALLIAALDEVDYGLMLMDEAGQPRVANQAARLFLRSCASLRIDEGLLQWHDADAARQWTRALWQARQGARSLIPIEDQGLRRMLAVVPLRHEATAVMVIIGRSQVCEPLSLAFFAQAHRLTNAEAAVLRALGEGASPAEIAQQAGVAVSTVRTQITSLRAKTGADSIRTLLRQVAALPPMVSALRLAGDVHRWCLRAVA